MAEFSSDPSSRQPSEARLTIGTVYSELRGPLSLGETTRVSLAFEQRTTLIPPERKSQPLVSKRVLRAELDFDEEGMARADMKSSTAASPLHISFLRQGGEYTYSLDGLHHGLFRGVPDLFDLDNFEGLLGLIVVRNLTIEQVQQATSSVELDALDIDVDIDRRDFLRLLRIFGDDTAETLGDLELASYRLHLSSHGDLAIDYWWDLMGKEEETDCRISCHVTLRVLGLAAVPMGTVRLDPDLPETRRVDDVWALARAPSLTDPL